MLSAPVNEATAYTGWCSSPADTASRWP